MDSTGGCISVIRFSIIVVCLNAGEELHKTIRSVLEQTFDDYEIIVKDGGSTDGSVENIVESEKIRVIRKPDTSLYDAMNQAIDEAKGEYLLFLNCGDYLYDRNVLMNVSACLPSDATRSVKIAYGNIYNRTVQSAIMSNPKIDAFACYRNIPCHQACFYENNLMKERRYDPAYRVRADYDHFLGCFFEEGVRPLYLPLFIASYEGGGFSETEANIIRSKEEHKEITARYMSRPRILFYKLILILTLAPLRTKIAQDPKLSGAYNALKSKLYRHRG